MINLSKLQDQDKLKQQINYTQQNLKLLKASIYYFYKLRNDNKISDKVLDDLTRYSCAVFVENQLENTIEKVLENSVAKLYDAKISTIEDKFESLYSFEESSKIIESLRKRAYV